MNTHLTDAELQAFAEGRLRTDDLIRADDHLAACADCRSRGAALNDLARASDAVDAALSAKTPHLSDEEIQLMVRGPLEPPHRERLESHLRSCDTCSRQVDDLRSWHGSTARPIPWLALAAAILLAALVPAAIWQLGFRQRAASSVAGLEQLDPRDQAEVRASLESGVGRLPAFIADVTGSRETLMAAAPVPVDSFAPTAPVATGTASDRPRFEWRPLTGADSYVVTVFDERFNEVMRSGAIEQPAWTPDRPLARGRTYVWQIAARRNDQTIVTPAAPMPPAKFHVIDAHSVDVLDRAQSQSSASHLLLGILNMNAGLVDEAVREFDQVAPTDPGADLARRSLERLRAIRGS